MIRISVTRSRAPAVCGLATWILASAAAGGSAITDATVDRASFNPGLGETVALSYELAAEATVSVRVYDPDGGLVRTLVDGEPRAVGVHAEPWDGKDLDGERVPNEAYHFTVETAAGEVWDPTTFSGDVVGDVTDALIDRQAGTLSYRLPAASRVLVRLGIRSGPLLRTLVDWKPRVAGVITEYWDGRDQDGLIRLAEHPGFSILVTHVTLPEASVIAYGNAAESYREVKLGRAQGRPTKPERPPDPARFERLRPEGLVPPAWARAPRVELSFPKLAGDVEMPTVAGDVAVHVDVDPADRDLLLREQFEIIFFVDNVFFAEAERGHLPFNWRWELGSLPPGEHVLTVNVSSFKGQVGVASRKVLVAAESETP